jgi:hypothetical protein
LAGVDGLGGEVLFLLFGHRDLLRFRIGLSCGGDGTSKGSRTQQRNAKARILFRIRAAWFLIGCD